MSDVPQPATREQAIADAFTLNNMESSEATYYAEIAEDVAERWERQSVEVAARAAAFSADENEYGTWEELPDSDRDYWRTVARAALEAAREART